MAFTRYPDIIRVPFTPRLTRLAPSSAEFWEGINTLSVSLQKISVQHAIIGSAAIFTYARRYNVPARLPSSIDVLIHPYPKLHIIAEKIALRLCSAEFSKDFRVTRVEGVNIPQVIVKRGNLEVLIDVHLLDHYDYPFLRKVYQFGIAGNEIIEFELDGKKVLLLNPNWLLRQKIRWWEENGRLPEDTTDVVTLCDVSTFGKMPLRIDDEVEIGLLKGFVKGFNNDPTALSLSITCPEVFGPWWERPRVKLGFAIMLVLFIPLVFDYFTSE